MKLKVDCYLRGKFILRKSGKEIVVDNAIRKEYNEDSEEYLSLCKEYVDIIGFSRESDKDKFDLEMLKIASEMAKKTLKISFETIIRVLKESWTSGGAKHGYVEFGGYLFRISDLSAVQLEEIRTNISKS